MDPHMIVKNTAILQENGVFRLHQVAPGMPSQMVRQRELYTVKNILKKDKDKRIALLAYRSTPLSNGYSPAEQLMGRRFRNTVPMFPSQLTPDWPNLEPLNKHETSSKNTTI